MRRIALCLAFFAVAAAPALRAQAEPMQQAAPPVCLPSITLDELTKALDDAVSGPGDKDRTCLRQLLLPEARLSPIVHQQDGSFAPRMLTVDDWINAVAKRGSAPMYEVQVKVKAESYGHFAHLWSTYEIRSSLDGKPTFIGINSVQAIFDGTRWHVLSVLWEPNSTAGPIPEKYLP